MTKYPLIGAHITVSGGYYKSIERAESIECNTMQIFTKSNRTWFAKKITEEDAALFKEAMKKSHLTKIMVHAAYLINLGTSNAEQRNKSINALATELERADMLGIKYLVLHPGAHTGAGEEQGIENIASGINKTLAKFKGKTMILLETSAGQGTNLGYTFEQLSSIYKKCNKKRRIGFCFDTCHVFSAGYNINTESGYKATIKEFDKILGLNKLKAIHLNSSKTKLGSRIDRHEFIGKGNIPKEIFRAIVRDSKLKNIPKILETPVDNYREYHKEIILLKKLYTK